MTRDRIEEIGRQIKAGEPEAADNLAEVLIELTIEIETLRKQIIDLRLGEEPVTSWSY